RVDPQFRSARRQQRVDLRAPRRGVRARRGGGALHAGDAGRVPGGTEAGVVEASRALPVLTAQVSGVIRRATKARAISAANPIANDAPMPVASGASKASATATAPPPSPAP